MRQMTIFLWVTLVLFIPVSGVEALTITSIVGDLDNFGTGLLPGEAISREAFINAQRTPEDGDMDLDYCVWCQQTQFSWQHTFELLPEARIIGAKLTIATFDLEDAGAGDGQGGEPYDDLLFLDGVELSGAFDETFTADGFPVTPNTTVFDLTSEFFDLLMDGSMEVLVNSHGGIKQDCIAIDYAMLEIELSTIPEPGTLLLLGLGLAGIGLWRRFRT